MNELLRFEKVSLTYEKAPLFTDLDLTLSRGETKVIMGPSGCGKTSLLRLAAGLQKPTSGKILRNTHRISVQFQEPRLLPWLTAVENVNAVLSDKKETLPTALEFLAMVGLEDAAHKYPAELSGGMAQRVALARALAFDSDLYLLDEPFRGLDQALRDRMISLVKEKVKHAALLLITHDTEVAERFGGPSLRFPL
ncbi:MAG: ATP-binding cassette domain-containing protein [Clostridia bacterium]|nr:ATP-binding cassette domain-containing protein [Clostridia bacterium]